MCCFAGPLACAAVVHVVRHALPVSEERAAAKVLWLEKLMGGGALLLALEHVLRGEIVPQAPFLTSANALQELLTVGSAMSAALLAVWGVMLLVSAHHERRQRKLVEEA